jgi:hypothetical protein
MHDLIALEVQYCAHQRRVAWLNEENWKFERCVRRHRVRYAIARALIGLANVLAPSVVPQEAQTT